MVVGRYVISRRSSSPHEGGSYSHTHVDQRYRQTTPSASVERNRVSDGGHCLVTWPAVCRPTRCGGLGLFNLQVLSHQACLTSRSSATRSTSDGSGSSGLGHRGHGKVLLLRPVHQGAPCSRRRWRFSLETENAHCFGRTAGSTGVASRPSHHV